MKQIIIKQVSLFFLLIGVLGACSDKDKTLTTIDPDFSIVSNDLDIAIEYSKDNQGTPLELEWETTTASDFTTVFYEIQFADESGSFENPAMIVIPENLGHDNFYKLSQRNLDIVCERHGVKQGQAGELKWRIKATNGIADSYSTNTKSVKYVRSNNFAESPKSIYVYGSSIGKDKIEDAVELRKISDNSFQLFHELKKGDLFLVNNTSGDNIRHYSITSSVLKEDGKTSLTEAMGASRLVVNFDLEAVSYINVIKALNLFWGITAEKEAMTFTSPSGWSLKNYTLKSRVDSKDKRDQRYKFQMIEVKADGGQKISYWGGVNKNAPSENPSGGTSPSYFNVTESGNASNTEFTFKFNLAFENEVVDINVDMSAGTEEYTHSIAFAK